MSEKCSRRNLSLFLGLFFLSLPSFAENFTGEIKNSLTHYSVGGKTENSFYETESLEYFNDNHKNRRYHQAKKVEMESKVREENFPMKK